jgi:hypothetical protein
MSTELLETCRDSNKHIIEKIVRRVGHLPELYEDGRSEKLIVKINKIKPIHSCNKKRFRANLLPYTAGRILYG